MVQQGNTQHGQLSAKHAGGHQVCLGEKGHAVRVVVRQDHAVGAAGQRQGQDAADGQRGVVYVSPRDHRAAAEQVKVPVHADDAHPLHIVPLQVGRQQTGDGVFIRDHQVAAVEPVGVAEGHGAHQSQKSAAGLAQAGIAQKGGAGEGDNGGKAVIAIQQSVSGSAGLFLAVPGQGEKVGEQLQVAHLCHRGQNVFWLGHRRA